MDWKTEKEKLQIMSFTKKAEYLFTYYKWVAFLLLLIILLLIYFGDLAYRSTKTFVLQGFIANDEEHLFDEKAITAAFTEYLNLGPKEVVVFDDSLYVQLGKADHYIEASMAKIYAYMAAKELDFLIAPEFVVDHYLSALLMRDFTEVFPDQAEQLKPYLKESFSSDGVKGFYKLDLGFTRFAGEIPLFMIIPEKSPHPEMVGEFLKFSQGQ